MMRKTKKSIISKISEKTGSSEEETIRIITEFAKMLKQAYVMKRIIVLPGYGYCYVEPKLHKTQAGTSRTINIPDAATWYIADKEMGYPDQATAHLSESTVLYSTSRFHILNELKSKKKSNIILQDFLSLTGLPGKFIAEEVFEISPKTLTSYKKSKKELPVRINEHILKIKELYKKGVELFEDIERFNNWLKNESYGLGNIKPNTLLNSITGIDLIYEELVRIEFGATA